MEVEKSTRVNGHSIKRLKELRDTITELDVCEQSEVLKIIEKNNIKFTENKNGVFINMNKLSDKSIQDIEHFLEYINNNYKKNLI
jgi:hypothetical protein